VSKTTKNQKATHLRLDNDFPFFSRHVLKIQDKETGILQPFIFNQAQMYLHNEIERQRSDIGKVRVLIVKGRQQGCSTYVEGRFYWRAVRHHNKKAFILSHQSKTTKMLFDMVERYWELSPEPTRPAVKVANRQELVFKSINSQYAVGTAGSSDVGRGGTVQLFHGSEVAFWENMKDIKTGVLQSIPGGRETEIILESTANGMSNDFYIMCMDALESKSDYRVIFIPWYWQDEYAREEPADGRRGLTEEEEDYKSLYGLEDSQIYWRRSKIVEFGDEGVWMFKQEYPAFLQEAFQTSGETLISPQSIVRARKEELTDEDAPLILGVDPARTGDRIILAPRQGRHYWPHIELKFTKSDTEITKKIAHSIAEWARKHNPAKIFIDTGEGWGIIDELHSLGFKSIVTAVNFGESRCMTEKDRATYINMRALMWCRLSDHIAGEDGPINLPDSDDLQKDLMSMPASIPTASGKKKFPPKEEIKKKLGCSPDLGDGYGLTHAAYVHRNAAEQGLNIIIKKKAQGTSSLVTLRRVRKYNKGNTDTVRKRIKR
jgi:hypothetical protein